MENLHAPTVPSGETSSYVSNGDARQLSFKELERKKGDIEAELKALGSVLDSHGVDMNTSLISRDGFPRADLDVAQVRTTRARIIRLRNDYKEVMARIEKFLHEHFASLDEVDNGQPLGPSATQPTLPDSQPESLDPPFAKVNTVSAGSPAEQAGLKPGDEVRNFGYVNRSNNDNLKKVAECVQGNEGSSVSIKVSRPAGVAQREELRLTLTPRKDWGGRGMLGCHILPL